MSERRSQEEGKDRATVRLEPEPAYVQDLEHKERKGEDQTDDCSEVPAIYDLVWGGPKISSERWRVEQQHQDPAAAPKLRQGPAKVGVKSVQQLCIESWRCHGLGAHRTGQWFALAKMFPSL